MDNPRNDVCGCCGTGKPASVQSYSLKLLIDMLEKRAERCELPPAPLTNSMAIPGKEPAR